MRKILEKKNRGNWILLFASVVLWKWDTGVRPFFSWEQRSRTGVKGFAKTRSNWPPRFPPSAHWPMKRWLISSVGISHGSNPAEPNHFSSKNRHSCSVSFLLFSIAKFNFCMVQSVFFWRCRSGLSSPYCGPTKHLELSYTGIEIFLWDGISQKTSRTCQEK